MPFTVYVNILPQENLLDPQGKAILFALHDLQFSEVANVRVGKRIRLEVDAPDAPTAVERARTAAQKLLANPISETFEIELA
jgi:phosphoribosylformylglycinamidine synthase